MTQIRLFSVSQIHTHVDDDPKKPLTASFERALGLLTFHNGDDIGLILFVAHRTFIEPLSMVGEARSSEWRLWQVRSTHQVKNFATKEALLEACLDSCELKLTDFEKLYIFDQLFPPLFWEGPVDGVRRVMM